jgi:hypothetical protein
MKITIDETSKSTFPFPKVMTGPRKIIVLFKEPGNGTILDPGRSGLEMADHLDCWEMDQFTDFENAITLKN